MSKLCVPLVTLLAILAVSAPPVQAQTQTQAWPQQPVRFILPFGPGAGADIGARIIQDRLQARWGKPVVIENRPGGDSMIAIQAVLAANDDHTFLWGPSGSFIVHPYQYKKLPYDPADLVPVARFSSTILGVGVPASMKIATLAEFVQRAHAEPGKFNSAAVPGITELAFDYFAHNAKITMTKVPYKDIVQAVNDLAEDRLQIYSASYAILRPHREAGRIVVVAQMGRERAPSLPDIPTGIEAGYNWKWTAMSACSEARPCRQNCASASAPTWSRSRRTRASTTRSMQLHRRRVAAGQRSSPPRSSASARKSPPLRRRSAFSRRDNGERQPRRLSRSLR